MKFPASSRRASGFTLVEMMIVISIIVVLAAMTIGGYNYAMRGSKRRTTEATMTAITSSLERYFEKNGEYPEPATKDEFAPTMPGKVYNVGGARCLYQALRAMDMMLSRARVIQQAEAIPLPMATLMKRKFSM